MLIHSNFCLYFVFTATVQGGHFTSKESKQIDPALKLLNLNFVQLYLLFLYSTEQPPIIIHCIFEETNWLHCMTLEIGNWPIHSIWTIHSIWIIHWIWCVCSIHWIWCVWRVDLTTSLSRCLKCQSLAKIFSFSCTPREWWSICLKFRWGPIE
jgi:hypothetical protein